MIWLLACTTAQPTLDVDDGRTPVEVTVEQRQLVGVVMRENLAWLSQTLEAAGQGDLERVQAVATQAATAKGPGGRDPSLQEKLPDGWRQHGRRIHKLYRRIAEDPESIERVNQRLAEVVQACQACHVSYRLSAAAP